MTERPTEDLDALAMLGEPVRRRLYEYVASEAGPIDRDRAAAAVEIGRSLAAFHLDRLAEGGLLTVEYHRRSGRTGPGAGRPAKFYRRAADRQVDVSLPPRRYGLAAEIMADGLEHMTEPEARERVLESARSAGARLATTVGAGASGRGAVSDILHASGYEPVTDADGTIRLRNCPFDALVDRHRDLTCSMNLALLEAVATRIADSGLVAVPRPADGFCCVAFAPASRAAG
jgi:predicted ArsR family transcriptional regulator